MFQSPGEDGGEEKAEMTCGGLSGIIRPFHHLSLRRHIDPKEKDSKATILAGNLDLEEEHRIQDVLIIAKLGTPDSSGRL